MSCRLRRVSCSLKYQPTWHLCSSAICGRTFPCRMPHSKSHIQHFTSNIPHSHIPHPTFHIPHSQHSSPKSTRFFPSRPAPRPNTPFSARHCNRLTINHLPSEGPRATFHTRHPTRRNAIFRPSIPALSRLHPLPFAPRYLSPRNPIHAQRPRRPSLTAFPPVPIPPPNPSNRAFPPSVSPKILTQDLRQIFLM